jgi:hypothetical protein
VGNVRACYHFIRVDPKIKSNVRVLITFGADAHAMLQIIEVINKTLTFRTSVNYQVYAPDPFANDVHEDLLMDLAWISKQSYTSDFELHIDFSLIHSRVNDGHCVWINRCYVCSCLPISYSTMSQDCVS